MTDPENQENTTEGKPTIREARKDREEKYRQEHAEFGKRIKSRRQSLDLTLDALARLTKAVDKRGEGVSRASLTRYEAADSAPGLRELRILSKALRMPLSYLVYGDSDDPMQFMAPSLDEALDQKIYEVVIATLVKYNLIPEEERWRGDRDSSPDFLTLLEQARKGE